MLPWFWLKIGSSSVICGPALRTLALSLPPVTPNVRLGKRDRIAVRSLAFCAR